MKRFLEIATARLDPTVFETGVLWGVRRGHRSMNTRAVHQAVGVISHIGGADEVKRILLGQLVRAEPEVPFKEFAETLRDKYGVRTAGIGTNDVPTMSTLMECRIKPIVCKRREEVMNANLILPAEIEPASVRDWQDVLYTAATVAISEEEGLAYV